jgi:nucleoside-diphosphate-sugar epimerase
VKILFIGCGDIAQRTAKGLSKQYDCFGLRRNPEKLPTAITPIIADASNFQQLLSVASAGFDIWVATLTPAEFTRQAYQQSYLAVAQAIAQTVNALHQAPKLIIWVSSTSVYGDNKGDWVDETTKPNPVTFSGEILLQAEQIIHKLPCLSSVVRFSGIYGPGRTRLLGQVRAGKGRPKSPKQWSNRIHADDCGAVLAHIMTLFESEEPVEPIYLASDCEPVTQHEIRQWLAQKLDVAITPEAVKLGSIRRCNNRLLLDSGFKFSYPSFKEGYTALIDDQQAAG